MTLYVPIQEAPNLNHTKSSYDCHPLSHVLTSDGHGGVNLELFYSLLKSLSYRTNTLYISLQNSLGSCWGGSVWAAGSFHVFLRRLACNFQTDWKKSLVTSSNQFTYCHHCTRLYEQEYVLYNWFFIYAQWLNVSEFFANATHKSLATEVANFSSCLRYLKRIGALQNITK